jgi:hypothetical protein
MVRKQWSLKSAAALLTTAKIVSAIVKEVRGKRYLVHLLLQ